MPLGSIAAKLEGYMATRSPYGLTDVIRQIDVKLGWHKWGVFQALMRVNK